MATLMRSGEFTACRANQGDPISLSDVAVDSHGDPSVIRLRLRKAKTDPYGKGILGRTSATMCPVAAILQFLAIRPPGEGPLLVWQDSSPLTQ